MCPSLCSNDFDDVLWFNAFLIVCLDQQFNCTILFTLLLIDVINNLIVASVWKFPHGFQFDTLHKAVVIAL